MTRLTGLVLSHRIVVILFWVIVTLIGFAFVQQATNALSTEFSLPGQPAYETNVKILTDYGSGGTYPPVVPMIQLPHGVNATSPEVKSQLAAIFGGLARELPPTARIASYADTDNKLFVSQDGRTTFGLVFLPPPQGGFGVSPGLDQLNQYFAKQNINGAHFTVTGIEPLAGAGGGGGGPGVLAEALIGGLGALIVLVLVFRSFMALLPLMMAVITIPTTFLLVWGLTTIAQVSFIVEFLVALIGLGVAIDYSLLITVRWREERENGLSNDDAVKRAMETAGIAVVFSGTTVAIGLFALVALPVPFLRSVGYGGMLIPLVSVFVAVTILPALLSLVGPKIDWPRPKKAKPEGGVWMEWGRLVVGHRAISAVVGIAILLLLLAPLRNIVIGQPYANSIAASGPAYTALHQLEDSGIGAGALTPFELLAHAGQGDATALKTVSLPGIRGSVAPSGSTWSKNGTQLVEAVPEADGSTQPGSDALAAVQSAVAGASPSVGVGGYTAQGEDFVNAVYGNFPIMILLIVIVTFILLARAFRSILLPIKAVILNIVSVGAAWGVMTFIWQEGHGSERIWGISATHSLTAWVPLMVFAFLFGLSMDYEVFILARTREEYNVVNTTDNAMVLGIGKTGRLVTSAALILFLAFVSLGSGPETDVKVLATGLAIGILLDATVIRSLLVPALVSLFGRWNWWLPSFPAKLLRVQPSAPVKEPDRRAA